MANKCYCYPASPKAMRSSHNCASYFKSIQADQCAQAPKMVMLLEPTTPRTICYSPVENQLATCNEPLNAKDPSNILGD